MRVEEGSVSTGRHEVHVEGDLKGFLVSLSARSLADGLDVVTLTLTAGAPAPPPQLNVVFSQPIVDTHARWYPAGRSNRAIYPEWDARFTSQMTKYAPVVSFYSMAGQNRLTFACSDAVNPIEIPAGVYEETAEIKCQLRLFTKPHPPLARYEMSLLIDTRDVAYYESLRHVGQWWETHAGYEPLPVPDAARKPLYSTWYSFHQSLVVDEVVAQCRLARELGCEAIIVDDGWQTMDEGRGYAYAGDWEPVRIGDMKEFVSLVHELGMKFLLWYSLPFVGKHSRAIEAFEGKTLRYVEGPNCAVLDPRYPDVREHLAGVFTMAMTEWDVDGYKLDFVDWFDPAANEMADKPGMDCPLVTDGADRLLTALTARLRAIKPDAMIEFRGPYTGPAMRQYANMFRSLDCPNDATSNRINTLDLRLVCGGTAVHSDMFMWSVKDSASSAALQLLNVLFSVPQVSVRIDDLPADHRAMLRFWLGFWCEHRDVLLDGELGPLHPESLYPVVIASTAAKRIVAIYDEAIANPGPGVPGELLIINATRADRIVLELTEGLGRRRMRIFDCGGDKLREEERTLPRNLYSIAVPAAGLVRLSAV